MEKKYIFSLDNGKNWSVEDYKTKESTINAAKAEIKSFLKKYGTFNILIGEYNRYEDDCEDLGEILADILNDRARSKLNEYTEDYMKLNEEELKILNERIKIVVKSFQLEYNHTPKFGTITNWEKHSITIEETFDYETAYKEMEKGRKIKHRTWSWGEYAEIEKLSFGIPMIKMKEKLNDYFVYLEIETFEKNFSCWNEGWEIIKEEKM